MVHGRNVIDTGGLWIEEFQTLYSQGMNGMGNGLVKPG